MLEESNAFTMVLLDLSSLQTNLYTRLRITDWQQKYTAITQFTYEVMGSIHCCHVSPNRVVFLVM